MNAALATRLAHDRTFACALAAGPFGCIALAAALGITPNPAWIFVDPLRFLSLAFAWPLVEEALFRGALQPALARTRWGAREAWGLTTANVATSALFAAAHLATHAPEWAAGVFVPSLVFGHFRDRYGSVAPAAALHVLYNAGYFVLVAR